MTKEEVLALPKEDDRFKDDWFDGYEQGRADLLIELKEKHHIDLTELYPEMKGEQNE